MSAGLDPMVAGDGSGDMSGGGAPLVRAYLDAFLSGRLDEFEHLIAPTFRFSFLPLDYGEGVQQVLRWREFSFSLFRKWSWTITDIKEDGSKVIVWLIFSGSDPIDPDTVPRYDDESLLSFEIKDGLIIGCDAMNPALEGLTDIPDPPTPAQRGAN